MEKGFERIILPVDGSDHSNKAVKKAFILAKKLEIPIYAIHVKEQTFLIHDPQLMNPLDKLMHDQADTYLKDINDLREKTGVPVLTRVKKGIPYIEIVEEANDSDLIIMGIKGKTNFHKLLIGSVSEKVIRHAPCPVLLVRLNI